MRVFADVESFSCCDLRQKGAYIYSRDPSTILLCITFITEYGEMLDWVEDTPLPQPVIDWALDPSVKWVAHNAAFEIMMLNGPPGKKIGFPGVPLGRWIDVMAKTLNMGLPGGLGKCCDILDLPVQKDDMGHNIMMKLSRPRKPSQTNPDIRWTPQTKPDDFRRLYKYCNQDVCATIELHNRVGELSEYEQSVWELDFVINMRGLLVDIDTVRKVLKLRDERVEALEQECKQITGGIRSGKREEILAWLKERGVDLPDYQKTTLTDHVAVVADSRAKRVLEIRLETGMVSTKKYAALDRCVADDNRVRWTLQYHSAGTGRWGGRIFNPQNIKRGSIKNIERAIKDLFELNEVGRDILYGGTMEMFSSLIRAMIMAAPGCELVVSDYKSIEARVVQWLAMDLAALDVFRRGLDVYIDMATSIFNVAYDEVTDDQRFVGKTAILGLGYAMGWLTFFGQCQQKGAYFVDRALAVKTVKTFRQKYALLAAFWRALDAAAQAAINNPGKWVVPQYQFDGGAKVAYKLIRFIYRQDFLQMQLPSGRVLSYYKPWIEPKTVVYQEWDEKKQKTEAKSFKTTVIGYYGVDTESRRWQKTYTYGGKLCENATQAVARDIMAHGIFNVEADGHPVIMHVHDEVVAEVQKGTLSVARMGELICDLPFWAKGCPIEAEGFISNRYRK